MGTCIFCSIIAGHQAASVVYEDAIVCAFLDINPVNPGHVLVVPKTHLPCVADMDEVVGGHLFKVSMRLDRTLRRSGLRCDGVNLFLADGVEAGQEVPHVHIHVIPRFEGDVFRIEADWSARPSRPELDHYAEQLRHAHETMSNSLHDD